MTDKERMATALELLRKLRDTVAKGHLLVVPVRHVQSYFELTEETKNNIWQLVEQAKTYLEENFKPDGFSTDKSNTGIKNKVEIVG